MGDVNTLNKKIGWEIVLKAFGVRPLRQSLPTSSECPVCKQGRLRLTHDNAQKGAWGECRQCNFSGDMVSLAAAYWKCNDKAAVRSLQEHSETLAVTPTERLLKERAKDVSTQASIAAMLGRAFRGGRAMNDPKALQQLGWLGLSRPTKTTWSATGPGQLIGFAQRDDIEDACRPRKFTSPKRYRPRPPKVAHPDADGQLVVPFYDQPGRVASVSLVHAPLKNDWQLRDYAIPMTGAGTTSGGLAFHPDTRTQSSDGRVLFVDDIELYLRMHLKAFQTDASPIPLVCYRSTEAVTESWQLFASRTPVFWAPRELSPATLWRAMSLDGHIVCGGLQSCCSREYVRQRDPIATVGRLMEKARHWPAAVAALIAEKDTEVLADWLSHIVFTAEEQQRIRDACPMQLRPKLERATGMMVPVQVIQLINGHVEQRPTGWYHVGDKGGESLITNAPFRITEATHTATGGQYHVEASLHGTAFSFVTDMRTFERRPFDTVHDAAIAQGCGVTTFLRKWQKDATYLAKQLHIPRVHSPVTRVGYDTNRRMVRIPHFSVSAQDGRLSRTGATDPKLPAANITEGVFDVKLLRQLLATETSITPMSVFLATATQLLTHACGMDVPQVGLQGPSALRAAKDVGTSLGLPTSQLTQSGKISFAAAKHDWPYLAGAEVRLTRAATRRLLESQSMLMMPVTREQALYGLLTGTLVTIQSAGYLRCPTDQLQQLGPLMLQLLSHVFKSQQHELLADAAGTLTGTYKLLLDCLKQNSIAAPHLRRSLRGCMQQPSASHALTRTVAKLCVWGQLRMQDHCDSIESGAIFRTPHTKDVAVPRNTLLALLTRGGAPTLSVVDLNIRLAESATPCFTQSFHDQYCWVVRKEQFATASLSERRSPNNRLRVASA